MKRILLTRTDRLGDVVLTTPAIRALRETFPDAYIAVLVRPYTKDVLKYNPDIDEVVIYDKYGEHKSLLGTIRFALALRKKKFDSGIAFHPTNRVHMIMYIAGIPERIGYNRNMGWLLTKRIGHKKEQGLMHESSYNLDLLMKAGIGIGNYKRSPFISTGEDEKRFIDKLLGENCVGPFVVIHTGASCPSKKWPIEKFMDLSQKIIFEKNKDIIFVGDKPVEIDIFKNPGKRSSGIFNFTGLLRVGELAELLKRAELLVSNDSGPVHLATAVNTPVVSIFGRTSPGLSPVRWGPLGEHDVVIHNETDCVECKAHRCQKNFKCIRSISASDVMEGVDNIFRRHEHETD